jgi:ribonuclease P protein component
MVLSGGVRRSSANFSIRAMPNGLSEPRLGMIAAKKVARRAVDRNRAKRLVRELFRLRQAHVLPFDIVVEFRKDLRNLSCAVLRGEISGLLDKLAIVEALGTFKLP